MQEYVSDYHFKQSLSCVTESSSTACVYKKKGKENHGNVYRVCVTVYEKIRILDAHSLSLVDEIIHECTSQITAICVIDKDETYYLIGCENGSVRVLTQTGNEIFGYKEHSKKIRGIETNGSIAVSYSSHHVSVYSTEIDGLYAAFRVEAPISSVNIGDSIVYVCTEKGVVHKYRIEDLEKEIVDAEVIAVGSDRVLGAIEEDKDVIYILPDHMLVQDKKIPFNYRASSIYINDKMIIVKDTKSKCHLLQKKEEVFVFKAPPRVQQILLVEDKPFFVFADNSLALYDKDQELISTNGGREEIIGISNNGNILLSITSCEGRCLGKVCKEENLFISRDASVVLFEEEGMTCIDSRNGFFYIGLENGNISVRNSEGEKTSSISVCESPITSISIAVNGIIAAGAGRSLFLVSGTEKEEIEYEDDIVCVKITEDGSLVFVSLADNLVKISKIDGEHLLNLYGHAAPVVAIEVIEDKVYTLGSDKLVKMWGMRHGECRKTVRPGDPLGMIVSDSLIVVSTAYGLIYYLDNMEKIKKIEYMNGKRKGALGSCNMSVYDRYIFTTREHSVSLFEASAEGTNSYEQNIRETEQEEKKAIQEKGIYHADIAMQLEEAVEKIEPEEVHSLALKLSRNDLYRIIESMGTEMREKLSICMQKISESIDKRNPLILGWILKALMKEESMQELIPVQEKVRELLRKYSRVSFCLASALEFSTNDCNQ